MFDIQIPNGKFSYAMKGGKRFHSPASMRSKSDNPAKEKRGSYTRMSKEQRNDFVNFVLKNMQSMSPSKMCEKLYNTKTTTVNGIIIDRHKIKQSIYSVTKEYRLKNL